MEAGSRWKALRGLYLTLPTVVLAERRKLEEDNKIVSTYLIDGSYASWAPVRDKISSYDRSP
jgi:hypothetical protein